MTKTRPLKKPTLTTTAALAFAEGATRPQKGKSAARVAAKAKNAPVGRSGQVPDGDVRLTANIREDLHLKLKIRSARERTTVGDLIEQWIETWKG